MVWFLRGPKRFVAPQQSLGATVSFSSSMLPQAASETSPPRSHHLGVATPATPGVWSVSHRAIDRVQARRATASGPRSSFELITDVTFTWSYPANSAFVTGTFSTWEKTDAMSQTSAADGSVWVLSKALPPGDYQYKCQFLFSSLSTLSFVDTN